VAGTIFDADCNPSRFGGVTSEVNRNQILILNMKNGLIALTLVTTLQAVVAQEHLSRAETLKFAFLVSQDLTQLTGTPIATDVDVKRATAMRDGDYGAMVLPEAKLAPDALAKANTEAVPVGQLWLHRLTPMRDGWAVPSDELRLVDVPHDEGTTAVPQCTLGVQRKASGQLELAILGKSKKPLVTVPLKPVETKQSLPIEMMAERVDDSSGRITLRILGRYEASLPVTEL
jgi:hypothetical protein